MDAALDRFIGERAGALRIQTLLELCPDEHRSELLGYLLTEGLEDSIDSFLAGNLATQP